MLKFHKLCPPRCGEWRAKSVYPHTCVQLEWRGKQCKCSLVGETQIGKCSQSVSPVVLTSNRSPICILNNTAHYAVVVSCRLSFNFCQMNTNRHSLPAHTRSPLTNWGKQTNTAHTWSKSLSAPMSTTTEKS